MDKLYVLEGVEFEWDKEKYLLNLTKHGVIFEEAAEVFFDVSLYSGNASVGDERRDFVVGRTFSFAVLLVVFVDRETRTRIISARKANANERQEFEESW